MPEPKRRPLLANGQEYVTRLEKPGHSRPPEMPRSYDEARDLVKREVSTALTHFGNLPTRKRYDDEAVLCLRMHPDMTAKDLRSGRHLWRLAGLGEHRLAELQDFGVVGRTDQTHQARAGKPHPGSDGQSHLRS